MSTEMVKCPVCNGSGYGDTWNCTEQENYPCSYCNGKQVVASALAKALITTIQCKQQRYAKELQAQNYIHMLTDIQLEKAIKYLDSKTRSAQVEHDRFWKSFHQGGSNA